MIIDSHTHFPHDALPGAGQVLLENAALHGIGSAMISHVIAYPHQPSSAEIRAANQLVASECAANPGRLFFLAYLNPQLDDWQLELTNCLQDGAKGIKLWVSLKDSSGNLDRCVEVLERAATVGLPVLLHTFDRTDGNLPGEIGIAEFCRLSQQVPDCKMIAAHLGCNWRQALTHIPKASENTFFDCCGTFPERGMVKEILKSIAHERLLFGSDWPCRSFASQLFKIQEAELTEDQAEKILWRNCASLYRLPAPPSFPELPLAPPSEEFKTDHFCFCGNFPSIAHHSISPENLQALLSQNGVEAAMTVNASSILSSDLAAANRDFSIALRNLPRLRPLAVVNPAASDALHCITNAQKHCCGLWFSPYWHSWRLNDPAYAEIWLAASASSLPIYINCGIGDYRARPAYPPVRPVNTEELCEFARHLPPSANCCIQGFPGCIPEAWPENADNFLWTATHLSDYGAAPSGSALADQLRKGSKPRLVCGSEYPFRNMREANTVWRKIMATMEN